MCVVVLVFVMFAGLILFIDGIHDLYIFCHPEGTDRGTWENIHGSNLDMANTIYPIISEVCGLLCTFERINDTLWMQSGTLIYKREKSWNCISGEKNEYYCRCYDWGTQDKEWGLNLGFEEDGRYNIILEDKPLSEIFGEEVYSCTNEDNLLIPYYNKEVASANIGDTIKLCYNGDDCSGFKKIK